MSSLSNGTGQPAQPDAEIAFQRLEETAAKAASLRKAGTTIPPINASAKVENTIEDALLTAIARFSNNLKDFDQIPDPPVTQQMIILAQRSISHIYRLIEQKLSSPKSDNVIRANRDILLQCVALSFYGGKHIPCDDLILQVTALGTQFEISDAVCTLWDQWDTEKAHAKTIKQPALSADVQVVFSTKGIAYEGEGETSAEKG